MMLLLLLHESGFPAGMAVVIIIKSSTDFDPSKAGHESETPKYVVGSSSKAKDRRWERLGLVVLMVASYVTPE